MARMESGLLSGTVGRVGQVVVYRRLGRWCVRQHVEHIRDARSEAQLRQRGLFKAMMATASRMGDALSVGLRAEARALGLVDSNLFLRLNKDCFRAAADGVSVDWQGVQVSAGPVAPVALSSLRVEGGRLEARFEARGGEGRSNTADRVQLYVYCPEAGAGELTLPTYRRDRKLRHRLPSWMEGKRLAVYAFCTDMGDATAASPSDCLLWEGAEAGDEEEGMEITTVADMATMADGAEREEEVERVEDVEHWRPRQQQSEHQQGDSVP